MPRKSTAALAAIPLETRRKPPPPPANLSARQRVLWVNITTSKPPDWFSPSDLPLLSALVAHTESFEAIERQVQAVDTTDADEALTWFERLLRLRAGESRAMASLATRLRLTPQSRYAPSVAATVASRPTGPRPWDFAGDERRTPADGDA